MTQEVAEDSPHPQGNVESHERLRQRDAVLGDRVVVLTRLRTRDGLAVAHTLLRYIDSLREPIRDLFKEREVGELTNLSTAESMDVALGILQAAAQVINEDELLALFCRLLGQPPEIVGDAPLEDSLNAVAAALSINDMPALFRAARAIWQEAQRIGEGF